MPNYSYAKQLNVSFNEAVAKTINAFKDKGFGVLTEIDVKQALKEKLGVEFKNYRILGMCNPQRAHKALQSEEEIGLLMPCNVVVYEKDGGAVVAAIKPTAAFAPVDNKELEPLAKEVEDIFREIIEHLS